MTNLKKLSPQAIPRALTKAERYRLLNEPRAAESICRDILETDPNHRDALRTLILALTDQFKAMGVNRAEPEALVPRLPDQYAREYYTGVILERWAKALLDSGEAGAHPRFVEAMAAYERAIPLAQAGNEDAILRWNTCARIIERHNLQPSHISRVGPTDELHENFDDEVPLR